MGTKCPLCITGILGIILPKMPIMPISYLNSIGANISRYWRQLLQRCPRVDSW